MARTSPIAYVGKAVKPPRCRKAPQNLRRRQAQQARQSEVERLMAEARRLGLVSDDSQEDA